MKSESNNVKRFECGIYEKGEIDLPLLLKSVKSNPKISEAGAILSFNGIVRKTSKEGQLVSGLTIDAYDELANKTITQICKDIKEMEGIIDVIIIHLKGEFEISDDLIFVVVASAHRQEGFEALKIALDRYKSELEVWKKEKLENGKSKWVH